MFKGTTEVHDWPFYDSSDDDLTPYDMSGDQEIGEASPPRYLRDCLESTAPPISSLSYMITYCCLLIPPFPYVWTYLVLVSSEDAARVELALKAAETLVRKNTFAAREVWRERYCTFPLEDAPIAGVFVCFQISVQMSKVLLHMEDKYSINNFLYLRQATMVALAVTDCIPVRFPSLSAAFASS